MIAHAARPLRGAAIALLAWMTPTPQADDFPGGSGISAVGVTSAVTLDPGGAYNNIYTAHYYVSLTINAHSQTFGSATLVVSVETNDGSGWVERSAPSYMCGYSTSWPPPYAARTCSWSDLQQAITVAGLGLTDGIRLRAKSFSTSNGAGGSFVIRGGDGAGANPGTYNGVTYATEPYGVQVGPDPGSQSVYAGSTGNVATFTVQNLGNQGLLTYQLSVVSCTAPLTNCTSDAASIDVGQGLTQNATVHFDAQSTTGTGSIVLRATHSASGTTDDGTINVSLQSFAVEVGPDPGSKSVGAGMTGQVATFTVKNNGNQGQLTYALTIVGCTAPIVNCTSDAASVSVAQGVTETVFAHFDAQSTTGTGSIVLRATHTASGTSNDGTINVTVVPPSFAVQVGPDPGTAYGLGGSTGNAASFTVQNLGNQGTLTYALSIAGCAAPMVNCTSDAPSVDVAQGSTRTVTAHFDAQDTPGTGNIVLRATHTASGANDQGTINVTTTTAQSDNFVGAEVNLDPGGASGDTYTVHYATSVTINGHSETFGSATLVVAIETNDGSGWVERAAPSFNCGYTTSWPPPYAARTCFWTGLQQAITVAGLGLNDDIRLRAKSFSTSNGAGGTYSFSGSSVTYQTPLLPNYAVQVGPDPGSRSAYSGSTGNIASFTVQNLGNVGPTTYALSIVGCTSPLINCAPVEPSVPVDRGATVPVSVRFDVQNSTGTGVITLRSTHTPSGTSNDGTINVTVTPPPSYAVFIMPFPSSQTVSGRSTGNVAKFSLQNQGNQGTLTYALSILACPAPLSNCTTDPSVTIGQGLWKDVIVRFDAQNVGGTPGLTLRATHTPSSTSGDGTMNVSVNRVLSWVETDGRFVMDTRYLRQATAVSYDDYGRIDTVKDARDNVTAYVYGGNSQSAFLTRVTQCRDATCTTGLVTNIGYANGEVTSITDEGGSRRSFTYDAFARLREVKNHGDTVVHAYGYTYSRTSLNGWAFQAGSPNAVVDTTFVLRQQGLPPKIVVSTQFVDGLGRPVQTVLQDGDSSIVSGTQYDAMGRPSRSWKPYRRSTPGFDKDFANPTLGATAYYNSYHSPTTLAKPYVETRYMDDALERVTQVVPEYIGTSPPGIIYHGYGVVAADGHEITQVTDESGKKRRTFADLFGNHVKTVLGAGASEQATTQFASNVLGERTQSTDPGGLVTSYQLDTRGLLASKTSPDAGTVSNKYDKAGQLRYTQDANQAVANTVQFTTYDFADRPLVSGLGSATFSTLDPDAATPPALETDIANHVIVHKYDAKPTNIFPWSNFWTQISPLTLWNVNGRLAGVASKSNGLWQVTLYSYDTHGHVATQYTYTQRTSTTVLTVLNTRDSLLRDLRDAITWRRLTVGSNNFYHWYEYDGRGLLAKVFASTTTTPPGTADVTYAYRPSGELRSRQFAGGPLVPLHYTIREQLDSIGNPGNPGTVPFAARYAYHLNGRVAEAEFFSSGSPATAKRFRYTFGTASYDALNRLKSADFSSWSASAWTPTLAHDLANIDYDAAGNLRRLQRYRQTETLVDDLIYYYDQPGTNRLTSVADAISGNGENWDARSGQFSYDANGNLKTAPAPPYSITGATYDHRNLLISVTRNGTTTTTYRYNDAGQRISKQGASTTEMYVLDGTTTLAVYTLNSSGSVTSHYFNVLAGERVIGRQPGTGSRRYYHTDLLGSTRTVVEGTSVVESYDFEPWGLVMPGRTLGSGTKEGFTTKERDAETGLDYFGARYYMPALGRWTSPDPAADGTPEWSSYNYVLGNPVSSVDPDGRECRQVSPTRLVCWDITPEDVETIRRFLDQGNAYWEKGDPENPEAAGHQYTQAPEACSGGYYWTKDGPQCDGAAVSVTPPWEYVGGVKSAAKLGKGAVGVGLRWAQRKAAERALNAARNRAVAQAWRMERELIRRTGQGTRRWTAAEKDELLRTGKVSGYQGHHINSVNGSPHLAGNPDNIKFVKKGTEHMAEHGGHTQNPTIGPLLKRQ
jgi:RHS repeat-associated protein